MAPIKSTTHRRGFLGSIAAGAAAIGISTLGGPLGLAGTIAGPYRPDADGFEAWLGRIKGSHKQVFDSPDPHGGLPLAWTRVFLMTNGAVGVPAGDACAVLILRHDSIPMAMPDNLWAKYSFGDMFKITDTATNSPAIRNPYYNPKPGELPLPDMSVEALLESGVLIGVCDMALTVYSGKASKKMNMDPAEVKKEWVASIFPGIQIVPSGVLAVNRAQEHGCSYCFAG